MLSAFFSHLLPSYKLVHAVFYSVVFISDSFYGTNIGRVNTRYWDLLLLLLLLK